MGINTIAERIDSRVNGITQKDIRYGDIEWLRSVYKEFNKLFFEGKLPNNLIFSWSTRMKTTAGTCSYKYGSTRNKIPTEIRISIPFMKKNPEEIYEVIIHEMIHVRYPEAGHGELFYREMDRINAVYGLNITRFTKNQGVRPYTYGCKDCNNTFTRARRFDVNHYHCGNCKGKLYERTGAK